MKKIKIGFRNLSATNQILKTRSIVSRMRENTNFSQPNPSLEDVTAAANALETALDEALDGSKVKKAFARKCRTEMFSHVTSLGAYVQNVSAGDEHVILSSGFDIQKTRTQPRPVDIPVNVQAKAGQLDGQVLLNWNKCSGAMSYVIETSIDGVNWTPCGISTRCKISITGLVSGSKSAFRLAAVGSLGQSGWSDPAMVRIG